MINFDIDILFFKHLYLSEKEPFVQRLQNDVLPEPLFPIIIILIILLSKNVSIFINYFLIFKFINIMEKNIKYLYGI